MRHCIAIADPSGVAESRRLARALAEEAGQSDDRIERVAIVATEMATNLLRHAQSGQILLQRQPGSDWIALAAIDQGPGIADLGAAMEDGTTSGSSSGTGLGAMQRLSDGFEIHSVAERGTVIACEFGSGPRHLAGVEIAGFLMNYPGERACGDGWAARDRDGILDLMLVDGLGHGPRAEEAADQAIAGFAARRDDDPARLLSQLSADLAGTRGSVACLAQIEAADRRLRLAGIGNVSALVASRSGKLRRLISREGRLGGAVRTPPVETADLLPGDTLILHSDGLATLRVVRELPQLLTRSCSLIAAVLMRDQNRGRDDACVVVARIAETPDPQAPEPMA